MKNLILLFCFLPFVLASQSEEPNTTIEKVLNTSGEFLRVSVNEIKVINSIYFKTVVAENLKSGEKTKGLFIGNDWTFLDVISKDQTKVFKKSYLDMDELNDLVVFFEQCHKVWKSEEYNLETFYGFTTYDGLSFLFKQNRNTNRWHYQLYFTNYIRDNLEILNERKSDDLYEAVLECKKYLDSQ